MTPLDLSLRFIPGRKPTFWISLAVTVGAIGVALAVRILLLGGGSALTPTATIFPALIVIAFFAGWRWGLGVVVLLGLLTAWGTAGADDPRVWLVLSVFFGSAAITVVLAGAVRELLIRLKDQIDARRVAEDQRQESETRFRSLADAAPTPMWVSRHDQTRSFVNRAYAEFIGTDTQTALGMDWRDYLHPDDLERVQAEQIAGEASGEPFVLEARFRRHDGQYCWLRAISRPRFGPAGERDGFTGIAFDITDSKQAQADLTRINELLNERVTSALAERDAAQDALMQAQKLEAVGQLTGGVAHDFNNLLMVIIGALDIIQRKPEDEAKRAVLIDAAISAARRGESLTQQLLAFARKTPQRTEISRIDSLLDKSAPLLQRALGEEHRLELDLQAEDACAAIDPSQLEAAVLNLIVNARDAVGPDGQIAIVTSCVNLEGGENRPAGDYVCIAVTDNGAGMPPETVGHAFEPFFTTKPVGKGTGLGLSQVYGFARQSGGSVAIESQPGKGTTVRILLPLVDDPGMAATTSEVSPSADEARHGLKVLLVEDDSDVARMVKAMLEDLGHTVSVATDVRAALRRVASEPELDLVLSDVIMPGGKTGVDLARELAETHPHLPVILSSGYTGQVLAEADSRTWALLRKPYAIEDLAKAIATATGGEVEPV